VNRLRTGDDLGVRKHGFHVLDVRMMLGVVAELVAVGENAPAEAAVRGQPGADGQHRNAGAAALQLVEQGRHDSGIALAMERQCDLRPVAWPVSHLVGKGQA
jgi:hypothetical protein